LFAPEHFAIAANIVRIVRIVRFAAVIDARDINQHINFFGARSPLPPSAAKCRKG
jgi:hypothetical protein